MGALHLMTVDRRPTPDGERTKKTQRRHNTPSKGIMVSIIRTAWKHGMVFGVSLEVKVSRRSSMGLEWLASVRFARVGHGKGDYGNPRRVLID